MEVLSLIAPPLPARAEGTLCFSCGSISTVGICDRYSMWGMMVPIVREKGAC